MVVKELDRAYVQSLHKASKEIFETMVNMPPRSIQTADPDFDLISAEVVGSLGFTGTQSGILIISSSLEVATACCANMLFMDISEIEGQQDIADSFGEITNMIAGNFKNIWVENGNVMDLAIPTVTFGQNLVVAKSKTVDTRHSAVLEFEHGELRMDLRFHD